jgi:hypothetical protein
VNALANPEVGKYLNEYFVSSFQKVASFRIVNGQKQGGNVASYFCTPDNRVLHAVAGPVNAATLLREARWVEETYKMALLERPDGSRLSFFFRKAHNERLRAEHNLNLLVRSRRNARNWRQQLDRQGQVHLLLASTALPRLDQVYKIVFEKILNERISTAPVVQKGT